MVLAIEALKRFPARSLRCWGVSVGRAAVDSVLPFGLLLNLGGKVGCGVDFIFLFLTMIFPFLIKTVLPWLVVADITPPKGYGRKKGMSLVLGVG